MENMVKWLSRKLGIWALGTGAIVLLALISALNETTGWQIVITTCVGMIVFAYIDGKKKADGS